MADEQWRSVAGYEGIYEVSDCGRVRSLSRVCHAGRKQTGKLMSLCDCGKGYRVVILTKGGKCRVHRVHRLVAEAFIHNPDPVKFWQINHLDADRSNNLVSNLEWCTPSMNVLHAFSLGRMTVPLRPNRTNCKVTEFQVRVIRRAWALGCSCGYLGEVFRVTPCNIGMIVRRRTWADVA